MKILSSNADYFLGYDGSFLRYLLYARRAVRNNSRSEEEEMQEFAEIIEDEDPDVVAALEVDQGSLRTHTSGQVEKLAGKLESRSKDYRYSVDNKYGPEKMFSRMPIMKHMSNAVFYREGDVRKHYVGPGTKQLVHETVIDDVSIFSMHLPTIKHFRRKQLEKIKDLALEREKAVLCGDFNTYWGFGEVKELKKEANLELHDPGPTNPSHRPSRNLDYFLVSNDLEVKDCRVIDTTFSDHRPVVLEVEK